MGMPIPPSMGAPMGQPPTAPGPMGTQPGAGPDPMAAMASAIPMLGKRKRGAPGKKKRGGHRKRKK